MKHEYDAKTKMLKIIDEHNYTVDSVKLKNKKEIDKYIRKFKEKMSFDDDIIRQRIDWAEPQKPRVYETKIYTDNVTSDKDIMNKIKTKTKRGQRYQCYVTFKIHNQKYKGIRIHGRSYVRSSLKEFSEARREAERNALKVLDYEVNIREHAYRQSSEKNALNTIEKLKIDRYEGVVWYEGK